MHDEHGQGIAERRRAGDHASANLGRKDPMHRSIPLRAGATVVARPSFSHPRATAVPALRYLSPTQQRRWAQFLAMHRLDGQLPPPRL